MELKPIRWMLVVQQTRGVYGFGWYVNAHIDGRDRIGNAFHRKQHKAIKRAMRDHLQKSPISFSEIIE